MDAATLDQFAVFVAIVDEGSFAAAARRMNRAQSAITYAIQKLEEQSGVLLFDRSAYRPSMTTAGQALLPRARRIIEDVGDYRVLARGLAEGLEAELSLAVDAFAPMALVVETLKAFHATFPLARVRIASETVGMAARALIDGWADLALMADFAPPTGLLERHVCGVVELVAVAAPDHPLGRQKGPIEPASLRDHVQLVLAARSALKNERDFGIHAVNLWHLNDLDTKHAMLRAGLGWGSMPRDRVAADLVAGRLKALEPTLWEGVDQMPRTSLVIAHRKDKALGPAGRWLVAAFTASAATS